ncbi:mitochondrial carrier [Hesseltinella vesiculosa]|uniref:Mitochondrial carrier n=1 Tax=Hesseltinella vesiculosa TaxID=101127 RepID=A0A1X2GNQ2_9FUNG|nr:mitochondrial carrier [Hesseltinella vesiculosa]
MLWANRTVIAASNAAVIGVFAGYPFDSVKTRLQSQHYDTVMTCVRQTYKEEGIRILPPLVTVSIIKSISFSVYEDTKSFCKQRFPYFQQDTLAATMAVSTFGGYTSGAFIAALSCPFELVKIQKQLEFLLQASSVTTGTTVVRTPEDTSNWSSQQHRRHLHTLFGDARTSNSSTACLPPRAMVRRRLKQKQPIHFGPSSSSPTSQRMLTTHAKDTPAQTSSWASAKEIVKKKGVLALYHGFGLHFLRDSLGTAVYFGGYETTKYLLTSKDRAAGPLTQFVAGGVCGILCWLIVFPIDLVKTLKQKDVLAAEQRYSSAWQCVQDLVRHRGLKGLYSGISVTLLRAFPIHSLNFLVYEQTLAFLARSTHHQVPRPQLISTSTTA